MVRSRSGVVGHLGTAMLPFFTSPLAFWGFLALPILVGIYWLRTPPSPLSRLQPHALARSPGIATGRHTYRSPDYAAAVFPRIARADAACSRRCRSASTPARERAAFDCRPGRFLLDAGWRCAFAAQSGRASARGRTETPAAALGAISARWRQHAGTWRDGTHDSRGARPSPRLALSRRREPVGGSVIFRRRVRRRAALAAGSDGSRTAHRDAQGPHAVVVVRPAASQRRHRQRCSHAP